MRILPMLALWAAASAAIAAPASAPAAQPDTDAPSRSSTHEYRLDNGLKVIVREDHRAPVVVSQVWYKVGSSYETSGITGISHMLEHMMFKGTENLAPGEFSRIISEAGGRENAFTGTDYTAYFQTLAADQLEVSLRLEAERMHRLKLAAEEFEKERRVVMEERRLRTEDRPTGLLYEQFNATGFLSHPYRNPVIGWMEDIEAYELADLQRWYEQWYMPSNAVLVVAGDVQPQAVLELARKYFADIPAGEPVAPKPRGEIVQRGERRLEVKVPARVPHLMLGYHVPNLVADAEQNESYALDVLAGVLDGGESARLASRLRRGQEVAASASAGYRGVTRDPHLFTLSAVPASDHTLEELEAALRAEVQRLREELVTPEELARVQAQVVAGEIYERDSLFYQAMQIGLLETVGLPWQLLDEYVERIRAVTAEQVRAVARKYLHDDNLTVAWLHPLPLESAPRRPAVSPEALRHGG